MTPQQREYLATIAQALEHLLPHANHTDYSFALYNAADRAIKALTCSGCECDGKCTDNPDRLGPLEAAQGIVSVKWRKYLATQDYKIDWTPTLLQGTDGYTFDAEDIPSDVCEMCNSSNDYPICTVIDDMILSHTTKE